MTDYIYLRAATILSNLVPLHNIVKASFIGLVMSLLSLPCYYVRLAAARGEYFVHPSEIHDMKAD